MISQIVSFKSSMVEPLMVDRNEMDFLEATGHKKLANCCTGCACSSDQIEVSSCSASQCESGEILADKKRDAAIIAIANLDLSMVKMKMCLPVEEDGKGWSQEMAEDCEVWYRRFLTLIVLYPSANVVPTKAIDEMWHSHILDTRKYFADCEAIFGEYLHHFPYLGLRGKKDAVTLQKTFETSCALFVEHFGLSPKAAIKPGEVNFAKSSYCSSGSACDTSSPVKATKCGTCASTLEASSCNNGGTGGGGGCSRNDISVEND